MATAEAIANAKRIMADPSASEAMKRAAQKTLSGALTNGGTGAVAPSPRELMMHYQRQIAGDDDYAPDKNPNSRRPGVEPYPEGSRNSMRAPKNTEIESMERRYGGDEGMKQTFQAPKPVNKQRSTKKNPVPRGTVGNQTMDELEELMYMMSEKGGRAMPSR